MTAESHLHPAQIEAFRRMTPAQKLEIATRLRQAAWDIKAAAVRQRHPDWTEKQIQQEVRDVFLRAAG